MRPQARLVCAARFSNAKMGKPPGFGEIVPGKDRFNYKHKIFWHARHNKSADQYNSVVTIYKGFCLRRWLEFIGGRIPKGLGYKGFTRIPPDTVTPRPSRYWVLYKDGLPFVCFTNVIEAWFVCLAGGTMASKHKWTIVYVDRTT